MSNIQLIQGDCLEEMKKIPDNSVDMILTDPPYFKVKKEAWDRQWDKPHEFLDWLDSVAEQWGRILKPNGSLYCFASPKMAARVEVMLGERFEVLNHVVWDKPEPSHAAIYGEERFRQFVQKTERIIFCEHYGADNIAKGVAGYQAKCDELRGFVFEPLRAYLADEVKRAGFDTPRLKSEWMQYKSNKSEMPRHWIEHKQFELPTPENYLWLRNLLNNNGGEYLRREYEDLRREYEDLRRKYEDLRRKYEDLRRPFTVTADVPYTDVWTFPTVRPYKGKHPCEKPQELLRHIISVSTKPEATVFDSFMGTGSTGIACQELGRNFIGIELDQEYYEIAKSRIDKSL